MTDIGELRLGIVGSGFMGHTYAEVLRRFNHGGRLVAVAGGRRALGFASEYGIALEPTVASLVARPDIDAVVLTTPESVHLEETRLAAAAGKHVMTEKPMAPDVAQCQAMIDACQAAGVTLMCVQTQRFREAHRQAHELIAAGRIGKLWQIRFYACNLAEEAIAAIKERPWYADPDGGYFLGYCVHSFDLMRWMVGTPARRVFANVRSYGDHGAPNLTAMSQVEFENGVMGHLYVCSEMPGATFPHSRFHTQIVGEEGLLDFDGYTHLDMAIDGAWQRVYTQAPFSPYDPQDPWNAIRMGSFTQQMQAFIDCILNRTPPLVPGADGKAAVELCQASLLSARTGSVIDLPL